MLKYACIVGLFAGVIAASPAYSQAGSGSFVGRMPAHETCPDFTLHIIRSGTTTSGGSALKGVVFRTDGTGTSNVNGEIMGNVIKFSLTPTAGQGPQGDVEGMVTPDGRVQIHSVQHPQCSLDTYLQSVPQSGGG